MSVTPRMLAHVLFANERPLWRNATPTPESTPQPIPIMAANHHDALKGLTSASRMYAGILVRLCRIAADVAKTPAPTLRHLPLAFKQFGYG